MLVCVCMCMRPQPMHIRKQGVVAIEFWLSPALNLPVVPLATIYGGVSGTVAVLPAS